MSESGAYRLVRRIGFSPVYVARGAAGEVAIRQFQANRVVSGDRERFLAAGREQMTLTDPSIVRTVEVIDGPEEASVVMEFVDADTLQTALLCRAFNLDETNTLLRRIALALDFAHSRGVVHGDLKPSNIFLLPNQEVMVGDFAISPRACHDPLQPLPFNLRHGYLSPEHFNVPLLLEARSDQFSLAVIAYEMYAGRLPFGNAPDHSAARAELMAPTRVNPKLPPGADAPLMRALSRNPVHRFGSCMEFISDLSGNLVAEPDRRKEKLGILPLVLGLSALLAIIAGFLLFRPKPEPTVSRVQTSEVVPESSKRVEPAPKDRQRIPQDAGIVASRDKADPAHPVAAKSVRKTDPAPPISAKNITKTDPVPLKPAKNIAKTDLAPPIPARNFTIVVLSRAQPFPIGTSFAINDPKLGELGHGDLKALVRMEGPPVPAGRLTIEWSVNGVVTERQKPVSPNESIEYENEPTLGNYKVTIRLDGRSVADFVFRITP